MLKTQWSQEEFCLMYSSDRYTVSVVMSFGLDEAFCNFSSAVNGWPGDSLGDATRCVGRNHTDEAP